MSLKIKINYDGKHPTLCFGHLKVTISGSEIARANKEWDFGESCLSSGGSISATENYSDMRANEGPWSVHEWPDDFPEELKRHVVARVNESITRGCCGGCI